VLSSLLTTKLYQPCPPRTLVARPRLTQRLDDGLRQGQRLILVVAPAGYGKTTLVTDWLGKTGLPSAWLSLDDGDNDPVRFFTYVVAALQTLDAQVGQSLLDAFRGAPQSPEAFVSPLINELCAARAADRPFILVLDDYHVITNTLIQEALVFLLDHCPPNLHLVILTRADPPFPLSRLRVRQAMTEIRYRDLRFTPAEMTAFLNAVHHLNLPAEQIITLESRTEGWAAGVQLAALSLQGREDVPAFIAAFAGSHHYIADYLVEEVLNRQSMPVQFFLLRTSILDRMTGSLCDALTEQADGQATLEALERADLFVKALDGEKNWYRYHPLFTDVLRNRLRQADHGQLLDLHRRAAGWYERNGFVPEALGHALAAGDQEYAAHLVEQNALPMMLRGELTTLLSWFGRVETQTARRPWLSIYQAWAFIHTGQQEKAAAILDKLEQGALSTVAPSELQEIRGHLAAIRAHIAAYRWDSAGAIASAHQALDLLPETALSILSFVTLVLGAAYLLSDDLENAGHYLAEARRIGKATGNLHVAVLSTFMLANLLADQGQLHEAVETYREALQSATTPAGQLLPVAARAYSGLGRVYYEWNDLEAVSQFADQCIVLARKWGNINALVSAHVTLARVRQARGDLEGAQACLDEAERLAHDHSLAPGGAGSMEIFQVGLWLAAGNLGATVRWVQRCGFKIDDDVPPLREAEYRTFARVLLAQNEAEAALDLVKRLLLAAESAGKVGSMIELLILQSLILQAKHDIPQALKTFERALALAEPGGYVRMFLDEGAPMIKLLRQAVTAGVYPAYVRRLLAAAFPTDQRTRPPQPLVEPLSERELEILRLVADGKSNQQIADTLIIATGTVKKHLNNIFGKLGAESRTQCVVRARELNLL